MTALVFLPLKLPSFSSHVAFLRVLDFTTRINQMKLNEKEQKCGCIADLRVLVVLDAGRDALLLRAPFVAPAGSDLET